MLKKAYRILCLLFFVFLIFGLAESHEAYALTSSEINEILHDFYYAPPNYRLYLYVDETGYGKLDLKVPDRDGLKVVSEFGPEEAGTVQITYDTKLLTEADYLSLDKASSVIYCNYKGDIDDIVGSYFDVEFTISTDSDTLGTYNYTGYRIKIDRAGKGINTSKTRLDVGDKFNITAFANGYDIRNVSWESSNEAVISVKDLGAKQGASGEYEASVTALHVGNATVTAVFSTENGLVRANQDFCVSWEQPKGTLNFSSATLYTGESVELAVNNLPEGAKVTFASSSKSKVKVGKKTGKITAVKKGKATITATVRIPASGSGKKTTYKLKCKITVKNGKTISVGSLKELQNALTDKKGGNYKLTGDISGVTNISISKGKYRLDLNGHTISGKNLDDSLIKVTGGSLVITDSKGNGKIENQQNQDAIGCAKGDLTIYGGEFFGLCYAVYMEGSGTLNIYGGYFHGYAECIKIMSGQVNIHGGRFTQTDDVYNGMTLTVVMLNGNDEKNPAGLFITGGNFSSNVGYCLGIFNEYDIVQIEGGIFEGTGNTCIEQMGGKTVITGGYFYSGDVDGQVFFVGNMTDPLSFTMTGGAVRSKESTLFYIQNTPDITITGGRFEIEEQSEDFPTPYVTILKTFTGNLKIADGLFYGEEIEDNTPEGSGLVATSFKRNDRKYKEGMSINDPDDLYSIYMDATEKLMPEMNFKCPENLYRVFSYYFGEWNANLKDTYLTYSPVGSYPVKDTDMVNVHFEIDYSVEYRIERACLNKTAKKNAGQKAIDYSNKIDKILKETVKSSMSDLEKATAIHDYMVKNYTYDYSFEQASYSLMGLLDNGKGVCQGYAMLYQALCNRAGLECYCVSGIGGEVGAMGLHMWNALVIDGKTLFVDVTFDDSTGSKKWLLKEEEEFFKDGMHVMF